MYKQTQTWVLAVSVFLERTNWMAFSMISFFAQGFSYTTFIGQGEVGFGYHHTWKKHMSPPVVHFVVCIATQNFWPFLHSFVRRRPNFWVFLLSFARSRLKIYISVGDRITGSPGFSMYGFHIDVLALGFRQFNTQSCKIEMYDGTYVHK